MMPVHDLLPTLGVHHLWQGALLFAAASALVLARREWSANQRAWIWAATACGMVLLPFSSLTPGAAPPPLPRDHAAAAPAIPRTHAFAPPVPPTVERAATATLGERAARIAATPLPRPVRGALATLWLAGAVACLLRLLLAWRAVRRVLRNARPLPLARIALPAGVTVLVSDEVAVPMALGFVRPRVVLPSRLALGVDAARIRQVIAHEVAHVTRGDLKPILIERLALAIFWWSPFLHAAMRRLHEAREMACDDRAAGLAGDPVTYAEALLACAETLARPRHAADAGLLAAGAFHGTGSLARRLRRLVADDYAPARGAPRAVMLACGLAALVAFGTIYLATPRRAQAAATAAEAKRSRLGTALGPALVEATDRGDLDAVEALLDAGADPDFALDGDGTALIVAVRAGSIDLVELLLQHGASVNVASPGDGNPLIMAAAHDRRAIARLLIDRGADVDAHVPGDETPLINAARESHLAMVRLLVEKGANPKLEVRTPEGERRSPLGEALRRKHGAVAEYLRSKGAAR